ncbi:hypothetical protein [Azomonas macrocytogenes]|uniref:Uncharacterized protein n=1 Tax=Azomonas macrocytogenes TaxID=69962 RepID=A0A839SWM7_AZOMA|nr:hypothetical protein [Azomonas macrocytogenes]MBB3101791.1 hypothetical protein [Azomonas macrocytogenes]
MKSSNGFDARRLRPRTRKNWHLHLGTFCGALLVALGMFLAVIGVSSLLGEAQSLGNLSIGHGAAIALLICCVIPIAGGIFSWRRCRYRLRCHSDELTLSPHLLKRRN